MNDIEQFIRGAAAARGIDPDIAIRVALSEGGITEYARLGDFSGPPLFSGKSWWPLQLHYGGAGYEHFGHTAGMGNGFTALTGWQPGDPRAWRDSIRYALNRAKANGWGAWYGAAHVGIGRWDGIDRNHPWDATAERWDYETGVSPMPVIPFFPDAPCDVQPDQWSCALQATQWLLRSIGRNPDASDPQGDPWMRSQLVPNYITPEKGLLDGSGRQLATWLTEMYGKAMGFTAHAADVTFNDVLAGAGHNPTMIGGRRWGPGGHWAGVRRADENGWFELANPTPGYTGVGTHLSPEEWAARGPWSCIYIDRLAMLGQEPPPPPPDPKAALRARFELIERTLAELKAEMLG